jgi:hypothetical protein
MQNLLGFSPKNAWISRGNQKWERAEWGASEKIQIEDSDILLNIIRR